MAKMTSAQVRTALGAMKGESPKISRMLTCYNELSEEGRASLEAWIAGVCNEVRERNSRAVFGPQNALELLYVTMSRGIYP